MDGRHEATPENAGAIPRQRGSAEPDRREHGRVRVTTERSRLPLHELIPQQRRR